jgi:16S rRNA pseudouridine516 synthase
MPRLDRLISNATDASRSQVRRSIRRGEVSVNGAVTFDPALSIQAGDRVVWRGEPIDERPLRYFMLHKPIGYECGAADRFHPSVFRLLDEPQVERLHIAGRLDVDTSGLVLLTDDGDWSHRVTAPRQKRPKSYRVLLADRWPAGTPALQQLSTGVRLRNDPRPTAPAEVEWLGDREIRLVIREGRYHQVRRMIAALGNRVAGLHRERIGSLSLDPNLPPGGYRPLTAEERRQALSGISPC